MNQARIIVRVNTLFEDKERLFETLKKYAKYSDDKFAYWDEFAFTTDAINECDALLIFNNPDEEIITNVNPKKVVAFMMEPGIKAMHPWMFKGLDQYAVVYSPLQESANTVLSHGFLGWHPNYSWQLLTELQPGDKKQQISCIASNLNTVAGHKLRNNFISELKKAIPDISYFGKGTHFLPDKFDGLLPYKYSIALENSSLEHYFTEKINDCFLSYTVPIYFGCANIGKYFPEKSFIPVNILDPAAAIKKIRQVMDNDDWAARIDALKEARHLVLNKYQPLAGAAAILRTLPDSEKQQVTIRPVPESFIKKTKSIIGDIGKNILMSR
jgi:hypothetical protein